MPRSKGGWWLLKVLAAPTALTVGGVKAVWSVRYALSSHLRCRWCGADIKLVRSWRCSSCGFTYVGSALRACRICGSRPLVVRCDECGLTWKI